MTINARALGVIAQTDDRIVQTVRLFQGVTPIRDITPSYPPGPDQATAKANLESVVRSVLQRAAADSTTVPCAPGTILDLSEPAPPPQPSAGFAAWQTKWITYLRLVRWQSQDVPSVTQARVDQAKADHEALWDVSFEAFL